MKKEEGGDENVSTREATGGRTERRIFTPFQQGNCCERVGNSGSNKQRNGRQVPQQSPAHVGGAGAFSSPLSRNTAGEEGHRWPGTGNPQYARYVRSGERGVGACVGSQSLKRMFLGGTISTLDSTEGLETAMENVEIFRRIADAGTFLTHATSIRHTTTLVPPELYPAEKE
jgi:hypothetical protein